MDLGRMRLSLRSYPGRQDTHVHAFHQAVLPVDGVMDIEVGDTGGSISNRHGVMITSGVRHVFRARGANRFVILDMREGEFLPATPRSPFFGVDETLADLTGCASRELQSGGLGAEGEFHLAALIAGNIRRNFALPAQWSDPVERALGVMRDRHAERLTMADVASAAGIGLSQFHELFRQETGRTPARMLADIRLDNAEALLARTHLPIAEIALLVGFSEQSALTRSLRRRRATTPRALRCRRA